MAGVETMVEEKMDSIDRQRICPFLLRVFVSSSGYHHKLAEYQRGNTPTNELQIYTWKDATLHELTQLVKEVNPETRKKGTKFDFAMVFPDPRATTYRLKEIGQTIAGIKGPDDLKSLGSCRMTIGDYIDIAISPPDTWNSNRGKPFNNNYGGNRPRPY